MFAATTTCVRNETKNEEIKNIELKNETVLNKSDLNLEPEI